MSKRPAANRLPGGSSGWLLVIVALGSLIAGGLLLRFLSPPAQPEPPLATATRPAPRERAPRPRAASDGIDADEAIGIPGRIAAAADRPTPARERAHPTLAVRPDPAAEDEVTSRLSEDLRKALVSAVSFDGTSVAHDGTAPTVEENVDFATIDGAALFPPNALLIYDDAGGIDPAQGAFVFWVRLEWDPKDGRIEGKGLAQLFSGTLENRFEITMGHHFVSFYITDSNGTQQGVIGEVAWSRGDWHHVAVTWGEALMRIYIDGNLGNESTYSGNLEIPPGTPLYLGSQQQRSDRQGTVALRGQQTFQRPLNPQEIAEVMALTAP